MYAFASRLCPIWLFCCETSVCLTVRGCKSIKLRSSGFWTGPCYPRREKHLIQVDSAVRCAENEKKGKVFHYVESCRALDRKRAHTLEVFAMFWMSRRFGRGDWLVRAFVGCGAAQGAAETPPPLTETAICRLFFNFKPSRLFPTDLQLHLTQPKQRLREQLRREAAEETPLSAHCALPTRAGAACMRAVCGEQTAGS